MTKTENVFDPYRFQRLGSRIGAQLDERVNRRRLARSQEKPKPDYTLGAAAIALGVTAFLALGPAMPSSEEASAMEGRHLLERAAEADAKAAAMDVCQRALVGGRVLAIVRMDRKEAKTAIAKGDPACRLPDADGQQFIGILRSGQPLDPSLVE